MKGSLVRPAIALLLVIVLNLWPVSTPLADGTAADTVMVFAAASTTNAVTEIGALYASRKLGRVRTAFAASSVLAKQIDNGAPADVYISANAEWMDYLQTRQMIDATSRFNLLRNRIVLIVPRESSVEKVPVAPGLQLDSLIGDGRLAMGDPDHVPAGMYGRQALEYYDVWNLVESKLARAKDVRTALMFVERGEAPLGLVYATDAAISEKVRVVGRFPERSHTPIVYPVALVAGRDTATTRRFVTFLQSPQIKAIFEKYGFSMR